MKMKFFILFGIFAMSALVSANEDTEEFADGENQQDFEVEAPEEADPSQENEITTRPPPRFRAKLTSTQSPQNMFTPVSSPRRQHSRNHCTCKFCRMGMCSANRCRHCQHMRQKLQRSKSTDV